jgi:hypothetical protein
MEDGDLVLTIIALIGVLAAVAIIVADDWRSRSKSTETRKENTT